MSRSSASSIRTSDDRQVAGDAVAPTARGAALVLGEAAPAPAEATGPEYSDPVGEPLEEVRLVGLDAEVMELDLAWVQAGSRPLEGRRLAVLVGEVEDLLARLGDDRREDRVRRSARGEPDPAAEAEDRIEHRADGVRQRPPVDDRDRRCGPTGRGRGSAPGRSRTAIAARRARPRRPRRGRPERRFRRATAADASRAGRRASGDELGLHEQVLERRVGDVGGLRGERDLGVRGQLDLAGAVSRGWSASPAGSRRRARRTRRSSGGWRSSRRAGRTRRGPPSKSTS